MANDKHGNPQGTTYSETGTASHATAKNLKNAPEGSVYNEDGSVFTRPADADKTIGTLKADIQGLKIAVDKGNQKVASATEMMNEADESDKPIFEKNINSQKIAVESNAAKKLELETKLKEFQLLLITPAQRADTRILDELLAQEVTLKEKIIAHREKMKIYGITTTSPVTPVSSAEQTANREAMIKEHGSQGKAIAYLVSQGWDNTKIYNHLGIPAASVPGPKNAWLRSEAGVAWLKTAPGLKYIADGHARA